MSTYFAMNNSVQITGTPRNTRDILALSKMMHKIIRPFMGKDFHSHAVSKILLHIVLITNPLESTTK